MSVSFCVLFGHVSDHTHSCFLLSSIYMSSSWTVIGKNGAAAAKVRPAAAGAHAARVGDQSHHEVRARSAAIGTQAALIEVPRHFRHWTTSSRRKLSTNNTVIRANRERVRPKATQVAGWTNPQKA